MILGGLQPVETNWYDCGLIECLIFDDENLI